MGARRHQEIKLQEYTDLLQAIQTIGAKTGRQCKKPFDCGAWGF